MARKSEPKRPVSDCGDLDAEVTHPHIAVASLGGTIAMTNGATSDGLTPTLTAADLIAAVPEISSIADVTVTTLLTQPSASMSLEDVLMAVAWARAQIVSGADCVVLVQGTDTLEESSFLMDLYWDLDEPLVLTGAMRGADQPGSDGPSNLLGATLVAADPVSRTRGVLVVMNDHIHAPSRVRKIDSLAVDTFDSGSFGPLGRICENRVVYGNERKRPQPLPLPERFDIDIALIETALGDKGSLLLAALASGSAGIVVGAFGVGHVSVSMATAISKAVVSIPVVFASRTGSGPTLSDTYGFIGSERDLLSRGAIGAGWLDPRKSRLLLWAALSAGCDTEEVRRIFCDRTP
jgi:L-asparaginase